MKKLFQSAVVSLTFAPSAGFGQAFEAGLRAAQEGDFETALKEWTPLAERGNASAQYNLGLMYEDGTVVPQDYIEALKWFRLAADQGEACAQRNLGLMHDNGCGVHLRRVEMGS